MGVSAHRLGYVLVNLIIVETSIFFFKSIFFYSVKKVFSSLYALFLNAVCFRSGRKGFKDLKDNIQMIDLHIHLNHECGMRSFRRRDRSQAADFLQVFFCAQTHTLSLLCVTYLLCCVCVCFMIC